jgi:hypothetical protein
MSLTRRDFPPTMSSNTFEQALTNPRAAAEDFIHDKVNLGVPLTPCATPGTTRAHQESCNILDLLILASKRVYDEMAAAEDRLDNEQAKRRKVVVAARELYFLTAFSDHHRRREGRGTSG